MKIYNFTYENKPTAEELLNLIDLTEEEVTELLDINNDSVGDITERYIPTIVDNHISYNDKKLSYHCSDETGIHIVIFETENECIFFDRYMIDYVKGC